MEEVKEKVIELLSGIISKEQKSIAMLYFNLDGYSSYCKKYKEYWSWVEKRNDERYKSNVSHDKNYDAKNMMHTFRLLHMAKEIGETSQINVKRQDRGFLLSVKNAEFEYDDLVDKAENIRKDLDRIYENSNLKEKPNLKEVNHLLISVRNNFYNQNLEL